MSKRMLSARVAGVLILGQVAVADVVNLAPIRDATLYEDGAGARANGSGEFLYTGKTGNFNAQFVNRSVYAFDVAAALPAGATINTATLTLHVSRVRAPVVDIDMALHRVTSEWGEGASDAGVQMPFASNWAAPSPGDATWVHTFHDASTWTTPGGDFVVAPSVVQLVGGVGLHTWTSAQMVADVQDMLDQPANDFGWILIGDELQAGTARQLTSREHIDPALRPVLTIDFDAPVGVPTVGQWGTIVLGVLLLIVGTLVEGRRPATA